MASQDADDFREAYFRKHGIESTPHLQDLWDELGLYELMQDSVSQRGFHEDLHALYDENSPHYDIVWHFLMDEYLEEAGLDSVDNIEGWYHEGG